MDELTAIVLGMSGKPNYGYSKLLNIACGAFLFICASI
jgi:hypothetical protein